ncbi:hypothetical protein R3I94_018643 [Phoxinus phoxinus]|uniref:Uncharacterized protein n=1 Tax=Phoxinus phoxinus TaxID=58324 RepID=A0AAN9CJS7_9TELE
MRGRREGERRSVCDREAAGRWGRGGRGGSGRGLVWVPLRRVDGRKKSNEQEPGDSRLFLTQFRGCLGSSDNPCSGIPLLSL